MRVLTESDEERNLAGGALDLSRANKRSKSLPDLSWENIKNSLFSNYPTRNKDHVIRKRRHSAGDTNNVNYEDWSNRDFTTESEKEHQESEKVKQELEKVEQTSCVALSDGSPVLRSLKRSLKRSPRHQ